MILNIIDIIILVVLAYGLLTGMYKGCLSSVLSTIGFVASWFIARAIGPMISNMCLSNETLMAVLNQYLEPESFFTDYSQAGALVSDVGAGGEAAIWAAVENLAGQFSLIQSAFSLNIRTEAFANLGLTTVADYLNQTLWVAVFNVIGFLLAFVCVYLIVSIIVNMFDHVVAFPVLRRFDWLVGGVLGMLKCTVILVLVLNVLPTLLSLISTEISDELISGSKLYLFFSQFDLMGVRNLISGLISG